MLRLCSRLSKNAVGLHLNSHKDAFYVLASFRVHSSKEALLDWSPRVHKSVLCVLGIEKQPPYSRISQITEFTILLICFDKFGYCSLFLSMIYSGARYCHLWQHFNNKSLQKSCNYTISNEN